VGRHMPKLLLVLLTAVTSLGQFANAVYLPSLPAIGQKLQASSGLVQATLTAFLVGFVAAQLVYGPLSDRFGRRIVLFWGNAIYVLGSVFCALAPDIDTLIGARVAQGVGACAGLVIARAIARDRFSGKSLSVVMAVIATAVAIVPGFVPLLGGIIQDGIGWRATFMVTSVLGIIVTIAAWRWLPESNASQGDLTSVRQLSRDYGEVLRSPVFRRNSITSACGMAGMFAFNAASPSLFIERLGTSATEYGIYPMITVCGYFIGTATAARLVKRVSEYRLIFFGSATMLLGGSLMLIMPLTGTLTVSGMVATMFVFVAGLGIVLPLASAASLQDFPHCAGTASAVLGCIQMTGAAMGAAIVSLMPVFRDASLASTMVVFSMLAVVWYCKPNRLTKIRDGAGRPLRLR